ncbi:dihydroorotate dehydrogenase B (NAD(+)), electron transfer subunit [Paraliobacillus quinghaiensis]|uniref:Dihydroorotate dehydrogenase B (NAD(+)), electron transfer subunit n=1 Tax=Paraliobacillus quinghaiensis TaxID=470815 RepID=A0A917WQE0_9BACI|nr:dihydroorotate dehydrogenase electron transfer subunit [Paraliobacillus quinghaiensis]GGM20864.1 dihydroorotate dehydrogenase B (NAD(+)), electron transfer subunit [Paraliobacillus quinghaiensis]
MITKSLLTIEQVNEIALDTFEMKLKATVSLDEVEPGQFIHIRIGNDNAHQLRRPISIADLDKPKQMMTIVFKVVGTGTETLAQANVGDKLDILLPCGTGYPIDKLEVQKALLIGGGIGVPPLYYLAKQLVQKGVEVIVILGFQSKEYVFYEEKFASLGVCHVVTNDGSYGSKGFVTNVIQEQSPTFDYYFSCGPTPMLRAVSQTLSDKKGYLSLEERMGCGVGTCFACVIPTPESSTSYKKVCQDGPVFEADEVIL